MHSPQPSPRAPQQQDFHLRALRDVFKWTATDEEMESIQNAANLGEPVPGIRCPQLVYAAPGRRGWSTLPAGIIITADKRVIVTEKKSTGSSQAFQWTFYRVKTVGTSSKQLTNCWIADYQWKVDKTARHAYYTTVHLGLIGPFEREARLCQQRAAAARKRPKRCGVLLGHLGLELFTFSFGLQHPELCT